MRLGRGDQARQDGLQGFLDTAPIQTRDAGKRGFSPVLGLGLDQGELGNRPPLCP